MKNHIVNSFTSIIPLLMMAACASPDETDHPILPWVQGAVERQPIVESARGEVKRTLDCLPLAEFETRLADALDFAEENPLKTTRGRTVKVLNVDANAGATIQDEEGGGTHWSYYNIMPLQRRLIHQRETHACRYDNIGRDLNPDAKRALAVLKAQRKK